MRSSLYIGIDLEITIPVIYSGEEEVFARTEDIKNNIFDFINNHKNEFNIKTLFEIEE